MPTSPNAKRVQVIQVQDCDLYPAIKVGTYGTLNGTELTLDGDTTGVPWSVYLFDYPTTGASCVMGMNGVLFVIQTLDPTL